MTSGEQLHGCFRLFCKILMGNIVPILWLFVWQPLTKFRFDGTGFWTAYGTFSVAISIGLWLTNRTIPDPSHTTSNEVATPIRGIIALAFQALVYFVTMGLYFWTS